MPQIRALFAILVSVSVLWLAAGSVAKAQTVESYESTYVRGEVVEVVAEDQIELGGETQPQQELRVRLLGGADEGESIKLTYGDVAPLTDAQLARIGDTLILVREDRPEGVMYHVVDHYRLPGVGVMFAVFFALVVVLVGWRGVTSLLGLVLSLVILVGWVIPQIAGGMPPLLASFLGSVVIAVTSLYLAHGFRRSTTLALIGGLLTLVTAVLFAQWFALIGSLFGLGTEDAAYLQVQQLSSVDPRGLFLAGVIIGVLGVLDDITTAQVAVVQELKHANASLGSGELFARALRVGREHIISLVNTLALAYIGAGLPMFLIFSMDLGQPLWVILNGEFLVEEIARTLVGSISLIAAVPITTYLAARYYANREVSHVEGHSHGHVHH